jgi:uncharacterized protein (DUF1800 family)
MGARPDEIADAAGDPRGWLEAQIRIGAAIIPADGLQSTQDVFAARVADATMAGPRGGGEPDDETRQAIQQRIQREARDGLRLEIEARTRHAASTGASFAERWARFWSNHFTVAARNAQMIGLVGPYEREAIRPHVFGRFAQLLGHAVLHPGMLIYLDAARSIGPSTLPAQRRDVGLNENLAREILELHTLGVGSGYTQDDIIEFAKALTGWTVSGPQTARLASAGRGGRAQDTVTEPGRVIFADLLHEPGSRTVLGKSYGGEGKLQAASILDMLAIHPATARHVAIKLARHFVSDTPPESAIAKLEASFLSSSGDLAALAHTVIHLDEAWQDEQQKFKTPEELLMSAARAAGMQAAFGGGQRQVYTSLAQAPFSAPSPAGWPDDGAAWSGADAIKKRLEWANAVSRRMARGSSPTDFLDAALGEMAGARTRQAVARAESAEQGFTLALMAPEFQRR